MHPRVPESQVRARRASLTHFVLASASVDGSHGQKNARFIKSSLELGSHRPRVRLVHVVLQILQGWQRRSPSSNAFQIWTVP